MPTLNSKELNLNLLYSSLSLNYYYVYFNSHFIIWDNYSGEGKEIDDIFFSLLSFYKQLYPKYLPSYTSLHICSLSIYVRTWYGVRELESL